MNNYISSFAEKINTIISESLDFIIARYERDPTCHFIDTKVDLISGKDFYPLSPGTEYRGKDVIYSWIQGRGLEALAGHARWLERCRAIGWQERVSSIKRILREVIASMESCRQRNHGHLFFAMSPEGQFLRIENCRDLHPAQDVSSGANYSDLFYSKGLLSAAAYLDDVALKSLAEKYFEWVIDDIRNFRFATDQQMFDPANQVVSIPGKRLQGPWMISLSGTALAADICDHRKWLRISREIIEYIFEFHINTGQRSELEKWDFWEAIDKTGRPWLDDRKLICDPGHALEFVGLSTKCLLKMRELQVHSDFVSRFAAHYPELLKHNFHLGFAQNIGIIKTSNLLSRKPINTDMPWWSLPETIRAAANVKALCDCDTSSIIEQCANAFLKHYVNPDVHYMAIQTLDSRGKPSAAIPAVPDADPAYHTGLSLIDFLSQQ